MIVAPTRLEQRQQQEVAVARKQDVATVVFACVVEGDAAKHANARALEQVLIPLLELAKSFPSP